MTDHFSLSTSAMSARQAVMAIASALFIAACGDEPRASSDDANPGIDSLNARLMQTYRARDPRMYGTLFTDTAVFEWPAFTTVRGRAGLEAMARSNWAAITEMDLALDVDARRIVAEHATEFGAFRQSYRDTSGARYTEYGRYVALLTRQADGRWLMDRFFGFSDSTRSQPMADTNRR